MIRPFGEAALLVELGGPERAQALGAALRARPIPGVIEAVPGLESLLVELDPHAAPGDVTRQLEERLAGPLDEAAAGRRLTLPVVYGGEHGPDLAAVAARCGLSESELVARHAAIEHRVLLIGFAPGFAYLGELPPELRVPRLERPRTHTAPGSVAVAGPMTGIYPADLPGGWRVIGRTPVVLFDPRRDPPAHLAPGDRVTFEPIRAEEWDDRT